ncbi:universal stress protein [Dietzia psychralcaliphila]|uniref:Universal stress protein UspA n=1 Tax=Dietzia psychralcaliphila TaxID=139021 RepID=A0AAD0NNB3_9ACTN|nr:universal stress protein [Dietzia psychralcaliphila]AWH95516.1 universal stress protein UspA [Dietzia psychralcaliphila]PTM88743.1 nucleotide-binding universal stress UspA family protein [Dietzia psychralcaliphila]
MNAKPVVVGVDGGPDSLRALAWAAEYASTAGAPLIALTAVETPAAVGPYAMAGWVDPSILEDRAHTMLTDAVRDTLGHEASVEQIVVRGHPAEAIVAASKDARLVVVGNRGRGGFAGMLLGSVSQHVVPHARCPVVVLPHQHADQDRGPGQ